MRIAQLCPPWLAVPPKGYGGIEWVVALLADGLVEAGHDVTLFATGDSETKARLEYVFAEAPGSKTINDIVLDTTHTLFSLQDARERFDVIHVHSPFSALAASVETGVPTVHTLHGSFVPHETKYATCCTTLASERGAYKVFNMSFPLVFVLSTKEFYDY